MEKKKKKINDHGFHVKKLRLEYYHTIEDPC